MKQFDDEYKAYVNDAAPDLWNRIEERIDKKIAHDETTSKEKSGRSRKLVKKENRKKQYAVIRLVASFAACLAALILIIPVAKYVKKDNYSAAEDSAIQTANYTIENTEEIALANSDTACSEEAINKNEVHEEYEEEVADDQITEIAYDAVSEETQDSDLDSNTKDKQGAKMLGEGQDIEEATMDLGEDDVKGSVIAQMNNGQIETIMVKITAILQDDTSFEDGINYVAEYPDSAGDGLVVYETWNLNAPNSLQILDAGKEYLVELTNIDRDNKKADIVRVVQ